MQDDVFRWVISIGVLLTVFASVVQAALVFAIYRLAKTTQDRLLPVVDAITPVIGRIHLFVDENAPRFSQIATVASQAVKSLLEKVNRFAEVAKDLTARVRANVARIDGAVDQTMAQVQQAVDVLKQAINPPVKQVEAIIHGIRAVLSVVAHRQREPVDDASQDEEMFL
jgi:phage-related protein